MNTSRRSFLFGLSTVLFAPAVVRASSLMPVKPVAGGYYAIEGMPTNHALWSGGIDLDFVADIARCPSSGRVLGKAIDVLSYTNGSQIDPGRGLLVRGNVILT